MSKFSIPDKLNLAQTPTPIHRLAALSQKVSKLGKVDLFVKRDDLTHGPAAGNKIRKLEFLLVEAIEKGKKVVFTCGGLQSNHARATAVLCRQLGLECVLFLRGAQPLPGSPLQGNLLIDYVSGARLRFITDAAYDDIRKTFFDAAEEYRVRDGVTPLFIPEGGSSDVGAMGYIDAFREITEQVGKQGLPGRFSSIVVANGSGGTHAGLLVGRNLYDWDECKIVSFNVCRTSNEMSERVKAVALGAIQRFRLPVSLMAADIHVIDGYAGPGYAQATPELYQFIAQVAREDGILLDPVYTGKALWGLVSELTASPERARFFGDRVLFIHTGGFASLFAHSDALVSAVMGSGGR
ncbi:MAG: D-cysteine desulfhydrase family protein [Bdellovibrionota bacterium]